MKLVIDANILFALLIKNGTSREIFFHDDVALYSPDFLLVEFGRYSSLILEKTHRPKEELGIALELIQKKINILPSQEIKAFHRKAQLICPDKNDIEYFAAALKLGCAIWSNDKVLKQQDVIRIYRTEELVQILGLSLTQNTRP